MYAHSFSLLDVSLILHLYTSSFCTFRANHYIQTNCLHYDTRTGKLPLVKQRNLSKMVKWSFSVS